MDEKNLNPAVDLDDEDADLSALDRGDNLDSGEAEDVDADIPRDEKGRFAAKDQPSEADKNEDTDEDETVAEAAAEDEPEDEEDRHTDLKSLEVARKKALQQRDAERARAQELEVRLKALESKLTEPDTPKVDPAQALNEKLEVLYEQVEEARADADTKKAAQLQREIDRLNREIGKLETTRVAEAKVTQAAISARYDAMLDILEAKYPELNADSEDFEPDTAAEINEAISAFEARGYNTADALRKAVKLVMREDPFGKAPKQEAKPEPKVEKKVEPRKTDVKKAVDTVKRQPPDASDRGVHSDAAKIDPTRLSDDEWNALPESKKRELRGDFIGV